jgi:NADH-quinone oxidoreductase subunit M
MLGQVTNGKNLTIPDMTAREVALFVPLIAWSIWIGIYPKPYFDILRQPVTEIVERVRPGYFAAGVQNVRGPLLQSLPDGRGSDRSRDGVPSGPGAISSLVSQPLRAGGGQ